MAELQVRDTVGLDVLISEVSKHVGVEWKSLARAMGFSQTDIDAIEYNNRLSLKEQICQLFHQWKQRESTNGTPKLLLEAIKKADLQEVIRILLADQYLTHKSSSAALATSLAAGAHGGRTQRKASIPNQGSSSPKFTGPMDVERDQSKARVQNEGSASPKMNPMEYERSRINQKLPQSPPSNSTPTNIDPERERMRQKRLERFSSNTTAEDPTAQDGATATEKDSTKVPRDKDGYEVREPIKVSWKGGTKYGVIKWMGKLEFSGNFIHTAGVEMDEEVDGGHDGTFNGNQYFSCKDGCGLLLPVNMLQRDDRFSSPSEQSSVSQQQPLLNQLDSPSNVPPTAPPNTATNATDNELSTMQRLLEAINELSTANTPPAPRHHIPDSGTSNQLVFFIPKDRIGLVVGREGKNIQEVERETNTSIKIRDAPNGNGMGVIIGSEENRKRALLLILTNLERRISQHTAATETIVIPNRAMTGRVIGRNGTNLRAIEALSGARVKIVEPEGIDLLLSAGRRECKITGSAEQIASAKELIEDAMRGVDVASAADFAAMLIKLASHFREMGFEFPEGI